MQKEREKEMEEYVKANRLAKDHNRTLSDQLDKLKQ